MDVFQAHCSCSGTRSITPGTRTGTGTRENHYVASGYCFHRVTTFQTEKIPWLSRQIQTQNTKSNCVLGLGSKSQRWFGVSPPRNFEISLAFSLTFPWPLWNPWHFQVSLFSRQSGNPVFNVSITLFLNAMKIDDWWRFDLSQCTTSNYASETKNGCSSLLHPPPPPRPVPWDLWSGIYHLTIPCAAWQCSSRLLFIRP